MSLEAWLMGLAVTVPVGALALLFGWRAHHAPGYWTSALGFMATPLALATLLPWLAWRAPTVLEPITPILAMAQEFPGVNVGPTAEVSVGFDWVAALFALWITGAALRVAVEARRLYSLHRVTSKAKPAEARLKARVDDLARQMGVSAPAVYTHAGSVMVTGVIRPRVYLNAEAQASPALDQIICHELTHMRRRDAVTLLVARLLSVALWFNPFVFAVEARRRLAAELECDRLALLRPENGSARLYARALLDAVGSNSGSSPVVGFGVAPRKAIEMRLTSILNPIPKCTTRWNLARASSLCVSVLTLGGVQAASADFSSAPMFTEVVVEGRDTSSFGPRVIEGYDLPPFHGGHDIAAPEGTPVRAPAAGVITYAGDAFRGNANWGHVVEIDHGGGWTTIYAHLSGSMFGRGDQIEAGQIFATVGNTGLSTGPHLHVEVRENGERRDPALHLPGLAAPTK